MALICQEALADLLDLYLVLAVLVGVEVNLVVVNLVVEPVST
jgi:hypothetical protein